MSASDHTAALGVIIRLRCLDDLRHLEVARHRRLDLRRDDAARQRARRDQPLAGISRTSTAIRRWWRRWRAPCVPATTNMPQCLAFWRCARRSPTKSSPVTAPAFDPQTEVQITCGATAGLYATLTAFVQPGDEVLLFEPCYDSYVPVIRLSGGTPVFSSLRYPDYRVDWDEVRRAISNKTRAILVNTPHNPTGIAWTADDMRRLVEIVDGTDILLIGDEVYEHVIFDGRRHESLLRYPELRDRACVISSFGKTFHTTGWKVGYCVAPAPILAEVQRVHQFMTFTVHTPSQIAFAEFVRRDLFASELARFYQQKRDLFLQLIDGSRFQPLACEGTYFQLLDYSAIARDADREMAMRLITEHGVASIPCSAFLYQDSGGPVLRFCFAKKEETLRAAGERLRRV